MAWLDSLSKAINYMEEHLLEDINYEDVAKSVYMSSYEFHRTFSIMAGMTANTYIRSRRLSLAGVELMETDSKVVDVALKYGYDSPESFTKAFTRFHGVAPKYAKMRGTKLCLFNPLQIIITMEGGNSMDYKMEVKEGQRFICLSRTFPSEIISDANNCDIGKFWDECHRDNLVEPLRDLRPEGKKDLYGLYAPKEKDAPTFEFGIGVLVDEDTQSFNEEDIKASGFSIWTTPRQQYAVFECKGENENCIRDVWSRYYKEFLPQMGYCTSKQMDMEVYYQQRKPDEFCEVWIPIEKVK